MGKKSRRHPAQVLNAGGSARAPGEVPATGDFWPALTGLRGLAALAVVLLHCYLVAGQPADLPVPVAFLFAYGWSGVDVFFTLSAFLLTIPFLRPPPSGGARPLRAYARARLLRIMPAYYVQVAVLLAIGALGVGGAMGWDHPPLRDVVGSLFFLYGALPSVAPHVPPWWTLPVELAFYLVLPLFARLLRPGRWWWLLVAIAASLAYRSWLMHAGLSRTEELAWVEHLPGRLHQFLVGMLAAYAFVRLRNRNELPGGRRADLLALASALAFLLLPALGFLVYGRPFQGGPVAQPLLLYWHLYASVVIGALLVAVAAGAPHASRLFGAAVPRALGVVSYSLYLWHYPVMLGLRESLGGQQALQRDFWPFVFYSLLFSLLVAGASWWMVERPAQRWGRQARLAA